MTERESESPLGFGSFSRSRDTQVQFSTRALSPSLRDDCATAAADLRQVPRSSLGASPATSTHQVYICNPMPFTGSAPG